jgi:hypothetical protein
MPHSTLIFGASLALGLVAPPLLIAACAAILAVQMFVTAVRAVAGLMPLPRAPAAAPGAEPVFSVHVAIHCEPPDVVGATLRALAAQDYPRERFEVLVVDNNTPDPALWQPVAALCEGLGAPFRFMHEMGVRDAKAGALTLALAATRADATHVVTVDADYIVAPAFLRRAAEALARTGADYVQFPQAYRLACGPARGVTMELEEYFRSDARMGDEAAAVLLTGTLSVIARPALEAVGGWSGRTTTEDAELGVRLCRAGYVGRYEAQVVGAGMLPLGLRGLGRQRYRWASGNLRTLHHHLPTLLRAGPALQPQQVMAIVTQLSAWLSFALVPASGFLAGLLTGSPALVWLGAASIVLTVVDACARLLARGIADRLDAGTVWRAVAARLALAPASARATLDACLPAVLTFTVTDKALRRGRRRDLPGDHLVLFALALAVLPLALAAGPMAVAAAVCLLLPLPAALVTDHALGSYRDGLARAGAEATA